MQFVRVRTSWCRGLLGWALRVALGVSLWAAWAVPAWANDRPFQVTRTAVLEDDEYTWSFESWVQRLGSVHGVSVEPEYTFGAGTSVQVELTRYTDRRSPERSHDAEVEFKHIFNDVARDGWGWGVSAALAAERLRGSERDGTTPSVAFKVPVSIALGDSGGFLHLNVGLGKARGERREWTGAAAVERELLHRTVLFAELAREGEVTYAQVGARHWLRRGKLAVDLSLQRQRADGSRAWGFIVGLGVYDF